jgi:hypothetical protein
MKRQLLCTSLLVGTLVLAFGARAAQDQPKENAAAAKLIGTWKLVSAKYNGQDSDIKSATTLKHITPGNFIWLTYDDTKQISRSAGGTYTLKDDRYEETPQYGLGPDFEAVRDKAHTFTLKIEGDSWFHNGELAGGLKIEEVWERVKSK